jgi:Carbohydrate-selective porin, OprB family
MNHFLRLSWLTTPAFLGILMSSLFGMNYFANAAEPSPKTPNSVHKQPNHYAAAIQSLISRYGCTINVYGNAAYYPHHIATRDELGVALEACLDQIGGRLSAEDRAIAQTLQEEFKSEIALYRSNIKTLEVRGAILEAQQFANSTNKDGDVIYRGLRFLDVKPTDWAYQSLSLLVKRSGCLVGAPVYFQPDRAPTRDELAAGLNACLSRMGDRFATKEDRELAQALQTEFKPELAALKERVDRLQAQNATLKSQQFSTTTKIQGQVVITFQNGF